MGEKQQHRSNYLCRQRKDEPKNDWKPCVFYCFTCTVEKCKKEHWRHYPHLQRNDVTLNMAINRLKKGITTLGRICRELNLKCGKCGLPFRPEAKYPIASWENIILIIVQHTLPIYSTPVFLRPTTLQVTLITPFKISTAARLIRVEWPDQSINFAS